MDTNNDLRVKDLKTLLEGLPDDMLVIIPVVDEDDVNKIYGFRKIRTAGVLETNYERECDRQALCINGATDGIGISDQVHLYDGEVSVTKVLV